MNWSTLLTELLKLINNFISTPKKQVEKVVRIYDTLHEILDKTSAERILVFKAHNGGGIIKPTGDLFATALYEDYIYPFSTVRDDFQKFPVDKEYVKMLLEVIQNKIISIKTIDMPECKLKNIYSAEGVVNSKIYYLRQDRKCIYYVSIASSKPWLNELQENVIFDILINKIKQNIK